jgi:two-component sensor histidine kinase
LDGPFELEVSRAMPLALLCYELLLNALKHAWPAGRSGTLTVEMKTQNGAAEVCICDDGTGFDPNAIKKGFGSLLVPALAREARADITVKANTSDGTAARISVK